MTVQHKIFRIIRKYRALLAKIEKNPDLFRHGSIVNGNKSKNKVIDFYMDHGRWPKRNGVCVTERRLGTRLENYLSKESGSFDKNFRRLVMITGRKSNNKRKHAVQESKAEILNFVKTHGRVPTNYRGEKIEGEGRLRNQLDYYTKNCNDMTLLGKIYEEDRCHRSGIPAKYRKLINESLNIEKPLIRLNKKETEND